MTVTRTVLLQTKFLEDTDTQQYIAPPNVKLVMVDGFIAANRTAGPVALIIRVVPSGSTPGVEHELFPSKTLAAGEVYEVPWFDLGPGDAIRTDPGAASSIVARIGARVVT
jgi:hypothetical protein